MKSTKECWIADPGEWARQILLERFPEGSETITTDDDTINAWHATVKEAIELKTFLDHNQMGKSFDLYVLRESGPRSSGPRSWRKAGLEEWFPAAKRRESLRRSVRASLPKRPAKKRVVRGRIGRVTKR